MKTNYLLILFLFTVSLLSAQEQLSKEEKARREKNIEAGNPFKQFGYKAKVATLSKGKYLEVHDLDSVVTIGSIRFHVDRKEIVGIVAADTTQGFDARPIGDMPSRWLSPDPLSEEYRRWSPYTFAVNNPVRFTDPDGMSVNDVIITGALKDKALEQLQTATPNLNLSMDNKGKITATTREGATLTAAEQTFQTATTDNKRTVQLNATDSNFNKDGSIMIGGQFGGSRVKGGEVVANQTVNPNQMEVIDAATGRGAGVGTLHETLEAYSGAVNSPGAKPAVAGVDSDPYDAAHADARATDPRHREISGTSPNAAPFILPNGNGTYQIEKYIQYKGAKTLLFTEKSHKP